MYYTRSVLTKANNYRSILVAPLWRSYAKFVPRQSTENTTIPNSQINTDKPTNKDTTWPTLSEAVQHKKQRRMREQLRDPSVASRGKVYTNELTPKLEKMLQTNPNFASFFETETEIDQLVQALTHVSYGIGKVENNERLCFLGKYALDMYAGEILLDKYCPKGGAQSGPTTRTLSILRALYANHAYLGVIVAARQWKWADERVGLSDAVNAIRVAGFDKFHYDRRVEALGDTVLAIIGAVYWTRGPAEAKRFVEELIVQVIPSKAYEALISIKPHKLVLTNLLHAFQFKLPKKIEEKISDNQFKCSYFVGIDMLGFATARTVSDAQEMAALNGIVQLGRKIPNY